MFILQTAQSACLGKAGPYGYAGAGCGYNALSCDGFAAPGFAYKGFGGPAFTGAGYGCGCAGVASTGGGLPCASASPKTPVGVSVLSENVYEGTLATGGNLPFLGSVGIEGVLPTAGAGAVSYGCGNSLCAVGMEEGAIATGIAPYAPGPYPFAGYGPAAGYKGYGGCGKAYKAGCGYGYGAVL